MKKRWLPYLLHAAVLAGLVVAGMKYVNGGDFVQALRRFDWRYAPVIFALSVGYVLVKGMRFVRMMREVCEVDKGVLMRAYVAGQACTLLPGGVAARAALLSQVGVPSAKTAAPLALSSLTDQALFLVCALVAALWYEQARRPVFMLLVVLAVVSLILGWEATRTWLFRFIDRVMGRFKWKGQWHKFLISLREITAPKLLWGRLANTAFAFTLLLGALWVALRGTGESVSFPALLLAFSLPTMLGRISALPGGVGVTEAGMVGVLQHEPGITLDEAAAAVTVFRLGTVVFAALVGGLVYLFSWRTVPKKDDETQTKPDTKLGEAKVAEKAVQA
jgi:uncharacterized protein (TIRG00374 family)